MDRRVPDSLGLSAHVGMMCIGEGAGEEVGRSGGGSGGGNLRAQLHGVDLGALHKLVGLRGCVCAGGACCFHLPAVRCADGFVCARARACMLSLPLALSRARARARSVPSSRGSSESTATGSGMMKQTRGCSEHPPAHIVVCDASGRRSQEQSPDGPPQATAPGALLRAACAAQTIQQRAPRLDTAQSCRAQGVGKRV